MAVLSIQSHVSYGHAGNSSSVFPLRRLGLPVYTVCFAHHTGYGNPSGHIFSGDVIQEVVSGIKVVANMQECQALMTGYLGAKSTGNFILNEIKQLKKINPKIIYSCDPVMGDIGRGFFTSKEIQSFFNDELKDSFDILTPNLFELEFLSGLKVKDIDTAITAARTLITRDTQFIIVTSYQSDDSCLTVLLISSDECLSISTPEIKFERPAVGTGDLFHALFLGNYLQTMNKKSSLEKAVNSIYDIIQATKVSKSYELKLIDNQNFIVNPKSEYKVKNI